MSSYGIEVEIWRFVYFKISSIKIESASLPEPLIIPLTTAIQIGPKRSEENTGLHTILKIAYEKIKTVFGQTFEDIEKAIANPQKFGSLRLNRSPIIFTSIPDAVSKFNFSDLSPDEKTFLLKNLIFSIDHSDKNMVLELITNPIGRYKHQDRDILSDQAKFLIFFFKFCLAFGKSEDEYVLPCSVRWHDPETWHIKDTTGKSWDYRIILEGLFCLPKPYPNLTPYERKEVWGKTFPQYNFSIDLSHFTLAKPDDFRNASLLFKKYTAPFEMDWFGVISRLSPNYSDPFLSLYTISKVKKDVRAHNMSFTELTRSLTDQILIFTDRMPISSTLDESSKSTIAGAFGYTIWYFFSLCIGGFEGNLLHKNLFLFMPKTSPIHFLKAAYSISPAYYHACLNNMSFAFTNILFEYFEHTKNARALWEKYLSMEYFFPRLARWYEAGADKISLITPAMQEEDGLRKYSNPLAADISASTRSLHDLILSLGRAYFMQNPHQKSAPSKEKNGVLLILLKLIKFTLLAASDDYRKAIKLNGSTLQKNLLRTLGVLLTVQDANKIPVQAQPGFGRPKLEARAIFEMPTNLDDCQPLVDALNAVGRPISPIPHVFEQTATLPDTLDELSIDLSISDMGREIQINPATDPWESNEYKYVWIPGKQEFGRRKEEDIRRWLASTALTKTSAADEDYKFPLGTWLKPATSEPSEMPIITIDHIEILTGSNMAFIDGIIALLSS